MSRSGVFKFHKALYFCLDTHRTERHSRHCSDLGSHPDGVCASVPESRRSHVHIFVRRAHSLCVPRGWSHQQTRRIRQARFPGTLLHVAYDILCRLPSNQMLYFRLESVTPAMVRKRFLEILWHVLIHRMAHSSWPPQMMQWNIPPLFCTTLTCYERIPWNYSS